MLQLIDRRLNGRNKSAVNRERFLRRYKEHIRKAVKGMVEKRSIADMDKGGDVNIPAKDISEPRFRLGEGGDREVVHSGNREFIRGDTIPRPEGGGGASGDQPAAGESVDDFVFSLSRDEFMNIFFEDLELPRMARTMLGQLDQKKWSRAGYVTEGSPSNLSVLRTLKTALGRRIALSASMRRRLKDAQARRDRAVEECRPAEEVEALTKEIALRKSRLAGVPFLDSLDLRYRNRVATPAPMARAVMFCLMDVSASMDESRKDLAKRFFTLLHLFLARKYRQLDVVFIRHTDDAEEVDEDRFFHDAKSGGTVVYSALELAQRIANERYPGATWNRYVAQASDGDAFGSDAGRSANFLKDHLLPWLRYFAYIEVRDPQEARMSSLWAGYQTVVHSRFAMKRVSARSEIYPVFRELFKKEHAAA